jgi:hypothetical protein
MVVFRTLALLLLSSLASVAALAGAPQHQEFMKAQRANAAALREYTWKSRTELSLKGETRNVRLEQVRYDLDGRLQKTQIGGGGQPQDPGSGRARSGGPLRQRVIAKKQEEFRDLMNDLAALAESYAHLPPDRLQAFATHATFTKGQGIETGSVRIDGRSVLRAGDEMVVWIDPVSAMTRRVEIRTTLESKPVHLVADYRSLENGLTYQARSVLRYPDLQLNLTVENFDYQFEGRPR